MNEIEIWFKEIEKRTKIFINSEGEFIINKGFKITKTLNNKYRIEDVRLTNMYSPVSEEYLNIFRLNGFIKGSEIINYNRNLQRLITYKSKIEKLYVKRRKAKSELPLKKKLNEKRIRNADKKIDTYTDLIFYYQDKINQYNNKYNNNE